MRREAVATAGVWVRPGADERQGPGSGPPPCGKSREQPPRPAPRRTRPGAQAAATRQALGVAARRRGADWRAGRRRRRQQPRLRGSANCAAEYFRLWRDRRAIASPTHRLRPPPTASAPRSNFSRCGRAPHQLRADRSGPLRSRPRVGKAACPSRIRRSRGSETIARVSRTPEASHRRVAPERGSLVR